MKIGYTWENLAHIFVPVYLLSLLLYLATGNGMYFSLGLLVAALAALLFYRRKMKAVEKDEERLRSLRRK